MAKVKKLFGLDKDDLAYEEPIEEICFTDYVEPIGDFISLFSVQDDTNNKHKLDSNIKDVLLTKFDV